MAELQTLQKKSLRYVANTKANSHVNPLYIRYNMLNINDMVEYSLGLFMYKYTHNITPFSFENFFDRLINHDRNLNFKTKMVKSSCLEFFPSFTLPNFWNSLSLDIKRSTSLSVFKNI